MIRSMKPFFIQKFSPKQSCVTEEIRLFKADLFYVLFNCLSYQLAMALHFIDNHMMRLYGSKEGNEVAGFFVF